MSETGELLVEFAKTRSERAFQELVGRYIDLVYSSALRILNGDAHLAQDVAQKVFADLAGNASALGPEVKLGGWLHRHTCFVAQKMLRTEQRRREREKIAMELNERADDSALKALTPVLDEAINQLKGEDRDAIMLRYFEQQDFKAVGLAMGSTEEGARKRVSRALEKLKDLLARRGVSLSATALGTVLSSQAVNAAPAGLAGLIAAGALAAGTAAAVPVGIVPFLIMTKAQAATIAVVALVLTVPLVMQTNKKNQLAAENAALKAQVDEMSALRKANADLSNRLAMATSLSAPAKDPNLELQRLRGEVGVLRKSAAEAGSGAKVSTESPLANVTQNPEMWKMLRDQQKMGLGMIYQGLGKQANLPPEKMEELNNLLADHVMTNITHITEVLKEGKMPREMERLFASAEAELENKVSDLIGAEGLQKFNEYNRNLASYLTSQQFKATLPGDNKEEKEAIAKQMFEVMQEERGRALAEQGLDNDFQTVPTLNFRNIASEQEAEKNLQLLDTIYARVQERAGGFMSPEQIAKFGEFRKMAIDNNKLALTVNRKLMAPPAAGK